MYLSDKELKKRICGDVNEKQRLTITSESGDFSIKDQVGVCSIDLRLSSRIWLERKQLLSRRSIIDLGNTFCDDQTHSRYWKEKTIPESGLILYSGQRILGRIDENIHMPLDCLGKIEARSGINRLLLIVTLGDFVNPGYIGHYPLQIINMSKHNIKIYPKMSVCQLLLSELNEIPEKKFSKVSNAYYADNGGPACWWEDRQLKLFMKENADLEKKHLKLLISLCDKNELGVYKSAILSRYSKFYKSSKKKNNNLDKCVEDFIKHEERKHKRLQLYIKLIKCLQASISTLASIIPILNLILIYLKSNTISRKGCIILAICIVVIVTMNLLLTTLIHGLEQIKHLHKLKVKIRL